MKIHYAQRGDKCESQHRKEVFGGWKARNRKVKGEARRRERDERESQRRNGARVRGQRLPFKIISPILCCFWTGTL